MTGKGVSGKAEEAGVARHITSRLWSVKEQRMISHRETLLVQGWEVAMRTAEAVNSWMDFSFYAFALKKKHQQWSPTETAKIGSASAQPPSSLPRRPLRFARLRTITQCPVRMEVFSFLPSVPSCHSSPLSSSPLLFFCSSSLLISLWQGFTVPQAGLALTCFNTPMLGLQIHFLIPEVVYADFRKYEKKIIKESKFYVLLLSQVIPTDIFMWLFCLCKSSILGL